MQLLFQPAKQLLNKFTFSKKFFILFLIIFFTVSSLSAFIVTEIQTQTNFTKNEQIGVKFLHEMYPIIQLTQQHRGLTVNVLSGNKNAESTYLDVQNKVNTHIDSLQNLMKAYHFSYAEKDVEKFVSDWESLQKDSLSMTIPEAIQSHNEAIAVMIQTLLDIADETNLTLDSDLENNHINNLLVDTLPNITEFMGKLRATGVSIAVKKRMTEDERIQLIYPQKMMDDYIASAQRKYDVIFKINPSLEKAIGANVNESITNAKEIVSITDNQLLKGSITIDPTVFFNKTTEAINSIYKLINDQTDELSKTLATKVKVLTNRLYIAIGIVSFSLILVLYLLIGFYFAIRDQVKQVQTFTDQISKGDLSQSIGIISKDEFGIIGKSLNHMVHAFKNVIQQNQQVSEEVAAASQELLAITEEATQATIQITSSVEGVSSIVDEQSHHSKENVRLVNEFSQKLSTISEVTFNVGVSSAKTSEEAENGNTNVNNTINQMMVIQTSVDQSSHLIEQLGERSEEIGTILNTITDIAQQTNLLSLNAAIEAARAGEHGKGFAVVANEVRKLADESAKAVDQIRGLIKGIQSDTLMSIQSMKSVAKETSQGMNLLKKTGISFSQIFESTKQVASEVQEVVNSTKNMLSQMEHLSSSINESSEQMEVTDGHIQSVAASTEEQLASMEEITSSVNELSVKAQQLQNIVEQFRV